jgi:hypothetical protein
MTTRRLATKRASLGPGPWMPWMPWMPWDQIPKTAARMLQAWGSDATPTGLQVAGLDVRGWDFTGPWGYNML